MPLPPEEFYVLSGKARIGAAAGSQVRVTGQAEYIVGTCLAPTTIFSTFPTAPVEGDTGGLWRRFARPLGAAPAGATAIRISFSAVSVPGDRLRRAAGQPAARTDNLRGRFRDRQYESLECDRPMKTRNVSGMPENRR